jgi:hypothetical protein
MPYLKLPASKGTEDSGVHHLTPNIILDLILGWVMTIFVGGIGYLHLC